MTMSKRSYLLNLDENATDRLGEDLLEEISTAAAQLRSGELSHTDVANWLLDLDEMLHTGQLNGEVPIAQPDAVRPP